MAARRHGVHKQAVYKALLIGAGQQVTDINSGLGVAQAGLQGAIVHIEPANVRQYHKALPVPVVLQGNKAAYVFGHFTQLYAANALHVEDKILFCGRYLHIRHGTIWGFRI